jgi:hypothetical protein
MEGDSVMRHFPQRAIFIAIICLLLPTGAKAQLENVPFKSATEAQQYVNGVTSLVSGADKINRAAQRFDSIMQITWNAMMRAFNSSETVAEAKEKFNLPADSFQFLKPNSTCRSNLPMKISVLPNPTMCAHSEVKSAVT